MNKTPLVFEIESWCTSIQAELLDFDIHNEMANLMGGMDGTELLIFLENEEC